ncbi:MAG: hypothetical protein L6V95_04960 [Candidatus Melainabacteria bacterium]|nr:MAG: hypothetical protein L6V95_04960 [Candidatus Melainabacteria bacterium]
MSEFDKKSKEEKDVKDLKVMAENILMEIKNSFLHTYLHKENKMLINIINYQKISFKSQNNKPNPKRWMTE